MTIQRGFYLTLIGFTCVWVTACKGYGNAWESKLEKDVTGSFYSNQSGYGNLLRSWEALYPNRCGAPAPAPGLVSEQAIISQESTYSVDINGQSEAGLTPAQVATRLGVSADKVGAVTDKLRDLKSKEIIQSGAAVKIISPQSDTHGILHVDETCSDNVAYMAWGKSSPQTGPYRRLKALGQGWYYYVEER